MMSLGVYNGYLVMHEELLLAKTLFSTSVVKFVTFSSLIFTNCVLYYVFHLSMKC